MPASDAQIAANRLNAQRSTGPKTREGKGSSRQNALKHGLTAMVVDLGDREEQAGVDGDEVMSREWLGRQVQRTIRRIDRGERIEDRLGLEAVWRASATWDEDRTLAAENVAVHLRREPGRTVARLRLTPQGCDWLIQRWAALARSADAAGDAWTEAQTQLAHDLLDTPTAARDESAFHMGDETTPQRAALARGMIAELKECRLTAAEADEIAQVQAEGDLVDLPTADLARLRRYDTALHRRLHWLMAALQAATLEGVVAPRLVAPFTSVVVAEVAPPEPAAPIPNEPKLPGPSTRTNPAAEPPSVDPAPKPMAEADRSASEPAAPARYEARVRPAVTHHRRTA